MSVFINVFEAVAVLLGMGVIGFWIISRRVLPENAFGLLSPLALDVALPALIFSNIISNFDPVAFPSWWTLPLWWAAFTLLAGLMTLLLTPLSEKRFRSEFALSLFYHNVLFLPLAVLTGMMGPEATIITQLFLFTLFFPSLFFGTYHLFFKSAEKSIDMKRILNPVMISVLAAVAIRLSGLHVLAPKFALEGLKMVGHMTLPIVMIIIGGNIYLDFKGKGRLFGKEIVKFIIAKNIVFPMVALGILLIVRPPYEIALIIILESAVPPLTAVPLVTERAGGNRALVNQFFFSSFLVSIVTLPAVLALFSYFFTPIGR